LSDAFGFVASDARGGLGVPVFAAAGNYASGFLPYSVSTAGLAAGTYVLDWEYWKDPAGVDGEDRVWLANVTLPDAAGTRVRFDGPALPQGWNASPFGGPAWALDQDPAHTYGVTGLALRSGAVVDQQRTTLRSSPFVLNVGANITFWAWVSSERGTTSVSYPPNSDDGDWLYLVLRDSQTLNLVGWAFMDAGPPGLRRSGAQLDHAVISNVQYPASLSSTVPGLVAVGASTDWDFRADYSQYGNALDIVAPSSGGYAAITTTDRTGADGYNTNSGTDGNYTNTFGGTSAAAPLAAGVAALLLTRNPGLSAELVRTILRNSAKEIGGVTYNGNGFNSFYGYGRLNAYEALISFGANISAEIAEVSPDPRATSVSSISLTFSEAVENFDLEDLSLTRDGDPVSLANATLTNTSQDRIHWTLGGLGSLTARAGLYSLRLTAAGSLITGDGGDYLDGNAVEEWLMDTINGTSGADTVTLSGSTAQVVITGDSYAVDLGDFATYPLYFNGGDDDDMLIVNLASGNPVPAGGVAFDGEDGEEDELQIVGTAGADSVTQKLGQVLIDSAVINYTTDVERLWVVLAAGNDTLTLDYSNDVGIPTGGIMFEAGDGTDTQWIYTRSANDVITFAVGDVPGVGQTFCWSDLESMYVDARGGNDTLVLDYSQGDLSLPAELTFVGGDGNDGVKILGSPTVAETLSLNAGEVQLNSYAAVMYDSNVEYIWAALGTGTNNVEVNEDLGPMGLVLGVAHGGETYTLTAADPAYTAEVQVALMPDAQVQIDSSLWLTSLSLNAGSQATLTSGGAKVISTKALSIEEDYAGTPLARLDLTDNDLIVDYDGGTPYEPSDELLDIRRWIAAGYNEWAWDGNGIVSSTALDNPVLYGLGYAQNDMLFISLESLSGATVDMTAVVVKFTYNGDLNLDGVVDDLDVAILGLYYDGHAVNTHYWNEGDIFGYDGYIDDLDVAIIGLTYGSGYPPNGDPL
jgi:subtilisin family serine protease